MPNFSLSHLIIILIIFLLFGAKRLPELGTGLGKFMRSFRNSLEGKEDQDAQKIKDARKERGDSDKP